LKKKYFKKYIFLFLIQKIIKINFDFLKNKEIKYFYNIIFIF
jgi:hypothetical protein